MVTSFSGGEWFGSFVDGLQAVRKVSQKRLAAEIPANPPTVEDKQAEDQALREVADQPAFAAFGPSARSKVGRGKWIVSNVLAGADGLLDQLPTEPPSPAWPTPDKAILLWAHALRRGLGPEELARQFGELLPPRGQPSSRTAAVLRVRSVMWLRGNRASAAAREGIERVFYTITAALQRPDVGAPSLAEPNFDYEWDRLARSAPSAEQQLLVLLSRFAADEDFPVELLPKGRDSLPWPLRTAVATTDSAIALVQALARRGLVWATSDSVVCETDTRNRLRSRQSAAEVQEALAVAVDFLRDAAPADTHFYGVWPIWKTLEAHVRTVIKDAAEQGVRLGRAAWVLDRMAVYLRETGETNAAVAASEEAVALSDQAQRPNLVFHGIFLGNFAMALSRAERFEEAVEVAGRALAVTTQSVGTEHEEYATSLNFKGNILRAARRYVEAREAHNQALEVIRAVVGRRRTEGDLEYMAEILNDYAITVLTHGNSSTEMEYALSMLDEAVGLVSPDAHGWTQIMWNRAGALRDLDRLEESASVWREVSDHAERYFGDPSERLLQILRHLAAVLNDLASPDADAVSRRADEMENVLQLEANKSVVPGSQSKSDHK